MAGHVVLNCVGKFYATDTHVHVPPHCLLKPGVAAAARPVAMLSAHQLMTTMTRAASMDLVRADTKAITEQTHLALFLTVHIAAPMVIAALASLGG